MWYSLWTVYVLWNHLVFAFADDNGDWYPDPWWRGSWGRGRGGSRGRGGGRNSGQPPPLPQPQQTLRPRNKVQDYRNLLEQARRGNKVDQCPCVIKPGSSRCITYDFRYQAATLPEAILNFPDLTMENSALDPSNPWRAVAEGHDTFKCQDEECRWCSYALISHMEMKKELKEGEWDGLMAEFNLGNISQTVPQGRAYLPHYCKRYSFLRPSQPRPPPPPSAPPHLRVSVNNLQQAGKQFHKYGRGRGGNDGMRGKRQVTTPAPNIVQMDIGTRRIISCVERGSPETENAEMLSMCSMCWAWRELPSDYFPAYLNELVCQQDTTCLSGWGNCNQRLRNLNVLRNTGSEATPQWVPVALPAGNCCECQVYAGTSIQDLIVGNATATN